MKQIVLLLCFVFATWASAPQAQVATMIYLAPYDGAGVQGDSFRPRGLDEKTSCVGLKPEFNWALCSRETRPSGTGYIVLTNRRDGALPSPVRASVDAALGRTITGTTPSEILRELLIDTGKIRPGRDGKLKIWLGEQVPIYERTAGIPFEDGGLFADVAHGLVEVASLVETYTLGTLTAWAATITEDWNCTDNGELDCDLQWTFINGSGWQIISNTAQVANVGTVAVDRADSDVDSSNHTATVTLSAWTRGTESYWSCGIIARKDSTATQSYYRGYGEDSGGTLGYGIDVVVANSPTTIGTSTQDPVTSDLLELLVDGSSISLKVNSTTIIGPITDTGVTADNRRGGVYYFASGAGSGAGCTLDNWSLTDISQAAFGPLRRRAG